jgi:3-hydroxyacyl-CoA dehydrogenase
MSRAIKKTPIVVNDTRGFFVNRCVLRYMNEATTCWQKACRRR